MERGWFVSFPAFAWSRSPVYTGRTKLALFIRRWPENGWETAGTGNVSFQLANFHLFALFFILANRLPLPVFPYVASSTLVCLLICLTCVSMMTQQKNSTKSEQNLKDKANSSNSNNNIRNNNNKEQQQQPKQQQQHSVQHL